MSQHFTSANWKMSPPARFRNSSTAFALRWARHPTSWRTGRCFTKIQTWWTWSPIKLVSRILPGHWLRASWNPWLVRLAAALTEQCELLLSLTHFLSFEESRQNLRAEVPDFDRRALRRWVSQDGQWRNFGHVHWITPLCFSQMAPARVHSAKQHAWRHEIISISQIKVSRFITITLVLFKAFVHLFCVVFWWYCFVANVTCDWLAVVLSHSFAF